MANRPPPDLTLTTTTSRPATHTVINDFALGGRRDRADTNATATSSNSHLQSTASTRSATPTNGVEPFPALPVLQPTRTPTYSLPPLQSIRTRPIGIRRLPSASRLEQSSSARSQADSASTRRRANTGPGRQQRQQQHDNGIASPTGLPGHYELGAASGMESIVEDQESHPGKNRNSTDSVEGLVGRSGSKRLRRASNAARSALSRMSDDPQDDRDRLRRTGGNRHEYESDVVDYLDVLDPEVSTLTTLTNVQNSLFIPNIPFLNRYINRRPTYDLSRDPSRITELAESDSLARQMTQQLTRQATNKPVPPSPAAPAVPPKDSPQLQRLERERTQPDDLTFSDEIRRRLSITSHVEENHYAVLPHGVTLEQWPQEDIDTLDDYVRHMLHSRRSKFKRSMKGFGKYLRKPLGFFVTLYAFLITIFGLIWVLFLIGWIYVGNRKDYIINVIDNVLVALFAIMGDGLAPFRVIDTYHMIYIAHYHRLSWKLRKQKNLPKLQDHNDLPERSQKEVCTDAEVGLEKGSDNDWEFSVLTPEQQRKLIHHQNKFSKSHSYYRPHETITHHAFPLKLLITIVTLLDCHSIFQIALGAFTWGWSYHTRPPAITATILSFSITVNIVAGIFITIGDKRTRKMDVLERMSRQGLTEEAMKIVEKKKAERAEDTRHLKQSIDLTHAINLRQGVVEPEGDETKKGAKEVKAKLKPYQSPTPPETDHQEEKERALEGSSNSTSRRSVSN